MPSRMAKLARKRKALKAKERAQKMALKAKLDKIKAQVAQQAQQRKNMRRKIRVVKKLDENEDGEEDEFGEEGHKQKKEDDEKEQEDDDGANIILFDNMDDELKGKTMEEQLAILEKSDESDLEIIRSAKRKGFIFTDAQWKLIVGIVGAGIDVALVFITLNLVEALLSGHF